MSNLSVNATRFLGIELSTRNSGHPGVGGVLLRRRMGVPIHLRTFVSIQLNQTGSTATVLSFSGHGSMLLYALLRSFWF